MENSLAHCDPAGRAQLAVVADDHANWLGVLPVIRAWRQGRAPLPSWHAWSHPNRFVGTPLVAQRAELAFWRGLLAGLGQTNGGEIALCLSDLASDDRVTTALFEACAAEDRPMALDRRYCRPMLGASSPLQPDAKQANRVRSLRSRLTAEFGPPRFRLVRCPDEVETLVEPFLVLEQASWKGREGSALACDVANRALFRAVARDGAAQGGFEMAVLEAGDRVLAISTQLRGRGRRYGFKTAYDESLAAFAPGVLLLDWLTREAGCDLPLDSCARPDAQPVSRLWPDRCELVDCRVALGGWPRRLAMQGLMRVEMVYSRVRKYAQNP